MRRLIEAFNLFGKIREKELVKRLEDKLAVMEGNEKNRKKGMGEMGREERKGDYDSDDSDLDLFNDADDDFVVRDNDK